MYVRMTISLLDIFYSFYIKGREVERRGIIKGAPSFCILHLNVVQYKIMRVWNGILK